MTLVGLLAGVCLGGLGSHVCVPRCYKRRLEGTKTDDWTPLPQELSVIPQDKKKEAEMAFFFSFLFFNFVILSPLLCMY